MNDTVESLLRSVERTMTGLYDDGAPNPSLNQPPGGFNAMRCGKKTFPPVVPALTPGVFPYYSLVPKTLEQNIRFRRALFWAGFKSRWAAQTIWKMCRRDILFWMNTIVWTQDPRTKKSRGVDQKFSTRPFITYPFQDYIFERLHFWLGECDIHWDKSRDMGASWMVGCKFLHGIWFEKDPHSYLMISRKMELVDNRDDPDALFPKFDFVLKHSPTWLKPEFSRMTAKLVNVNTGSVITGSSTTEDAGRGGRKRAIMVDEAASVGALDMMIAAISDATDSMVLCSTPKGDFNEFAKRRRTTPARIRTHWSVHPVKAQGLWQDETGAVRSPWYDAEVVRRASNPRMIAQELDVDYLGSGQSFFDTDVLEKKLVETARQPLTAGELVVSERTKLVKHFHESPDGVGRLSLWCKLVNGRPPSGRYVFAADVAQGTGASNSVISGADVRTREQVVEYASPHVSPERLGWLLHALANWFRSEDDDPAFLIWEAPGPGRTVGNVITRECGFMNVYWSRDEKGLARKRRAGRIPGWTPTGETKDELLMEFQRALVSGRMTIRSEWVFRECERYEYAPDGHIVSVDSVQNDPSGARSNHGDRVMAAALLWHALRDMEPIDAETVLSEADHSAMTIDEARSRPDSEVPVGSMEWRRRQSEAAHTRRDPWLARVQPWQG